MSPIPARFRAVVLRSIHCSLALLPLSSSQTQTRRGSWKDGQGPIRRWWGYDHAIATFLPSAAREGDDRNNKDNSSGQEMADPRDFQEARRFPTSTNLEVLTSFSIMLETNSPGRLHVHEGILPHRARGAVFDMDGTLLDTNDRRVESWQNACSKHGLQIDKKTYMDLTGMSGQDIVDKLCADQGVDLSPEERKALVEEENHFFKDRGLPRSPAVSPVMDVLEEAHRRGLQLAVCSGGRKDAVERSLADRGLADRFHAVVTSADVPHAKPEPDIFLLAAERLGLKPEECVAFEDAPMGKKSARAAGYMAVVDVTGLPGHPDGEKREERQA